ncbi:7208_t:CDS:2 [Funneliformis geosporum]|uniref:9623_t:CDS:1 n=1 Tax=Funneliformis geosporum TaxID=1117311 RepID=A0A9W4T343_9GLOM|nr:9623_t:CDS:2 [Funneliformis geosporum]CAI2194653.1 7208_t:CDS:2 [Funneliformis geosporum]
MTETANQLLSRAVPVCTWQTPGSTASTHPANPLFPEVAREWRFFSRSVNSYRNIPGGQFQVFPTDAQDLCVERDSTLRFFTNILWPIKTLLGGAEFHTRRTEVLGAPDYILCTNNPTTAKMPVEVQTRHNLRLGDHNLWEVYRYADRNQIEDENFQFKKRILSQVFGQMACNGLHFGILTNYSDTYFLKRLENEPTNLYVSRVVHPDSTNPTLRECVYYICQQAINDNVGNRLDPVSDDDKRKSSSDLGSRKRVIASSSKRITRIGEYIGGGTFGKVFSGYYDGQLVAWKTCDAYKEQEATKMLKHEAHVYSILKECQGRAIPHLFHQGYIYDGYLFALVLQLIEDAHHVDPERLTKEDKTSIVNQLKSIHNCGVLHNDISKQNVLYEPKSRHYFFIDFGLSEIVDNESAKLRKEERRLKRFLQL